MNCFNELEEGELEDDLLEVDHCKARRGMTASTLFWSIEHSEFSSVLHSSAWKDDSNPPVSLCRDCFSWVWVCCRTPRKQQKSNSGQPMALEPKNPAVWLKVFCIFWVIWGKPSARQILSKSNPIHYCYHKVNPHQWLKVWNPRRFWNELWLIQAYLKKIQYRWLMLWWRETTALGIWDLQVKISSRIHLQDFLPSQLSHHKLIKFIDNIPNPVG